MKNTLIIITAIIAAGFYFDRKPKVIETVKEIETIREMTPILVKPNFTYVSHSIEMPVKQRPLLVKPNVVPLEPKPKYDFHNEMLKGVKFFEGFKAKSYYCCAGVKTIGYGCTDRKIVNLGVITKQKASTLLLNELQSVREKVKKEVKVPLTEYQLCALTSFTYNLGLTNLKELINNPNRLNDGNYKSVEKIMPLYRNAGGKIKEGLVKRRAWEVSLWNGEPNCLITH